MLWLNPTESNRIGLPHEAEMRLAAEFVIERELLGTAEVAARRKGATGWTEDWWARRRRG